jgi:hypothetical protein
MFNIRCILSLKPRLYIKLYPCKPKRKIIEVFENKLIHEAECFIITLQLRRWSRNSVLVHCNRYRPILYTANDYVHTWIFWNGSDVWMFLLYWEKNFIGWRWGQYVPPKRWYRPHSVTIQNVHSRHKSQFHIPWEYTDTWLPKMTPLWTKGLCWSQIKN